MEKLLELSDVELSVSLHELVAVPMNDGGMGSLRFGENSQNRILGKTAAEYMFKDSDEVEVYVTLNLDQNNELYELDIWKTNFGETILLKKDAGEAI